MPKTVLVDESGDLGRKPGASKTMTMTATITDQPETFAEIAGKYEKNTRLSPEKRASAPDELKYGTSNDEVRASVLRDIIATNPVIKTVVADKSTLSKRGSRAYSAVAGELMDDVMKDPAVKGGARVVFDDGAIRPRDAVIEVDKAATKHGVPLTGPTETKSSIDTPELLGADFPAGAGGSKYNKGKPKDFEIIRENTTVRHVRRKR